MKEKIKKFPVRLVEKLMNITGFEVHQIEMVFIGLCIILVLLLSLTNIAEIVGSVAVFVSFVNVREGINIKSGKYPYIMEALWIVYFILSGSYSALLGAIIFIAYTPWRNLWHKYHQTEEEMVR